MDVRLSESRILLDIWEFVSCEAWVGGIHSFGGKGRRILRAG